MVHLLVTLDFAGRTWRLSDGPCDPVSQDGPLHYRGGLPVYDSEDGVEVCGEGGDRDISMEVVVPEDIGALRRQGHALDGQAVEVALWRDGDAYEEREVLTRGTVREPRYGGAGLPLSFQVQAIPDDLATYPDERARMSEETLSTSDPLAEGRVYPTIIGYPGVLQQGGTVRNFPGSPVYTLAVGGASSNVLVAGHYTREGSVYLQHYETSTDATPTSAAYLRGWDALGHEWGVYQVGNVWPLHPDLTGQGDQVYASWIDPDARCGPPEYQGRGLERAGDVLRWALERSSLPVDWERTAAAAEQLTMPLAGYWDSPCSPWQWMRDQVLPLLPVSMRTGPRGLYPVVWPWYAPRSAAVMHLETGRNCALRPDVVEEGETRASQVRVNYARNAATGAHMEAVIRRPDLPSGRGYSRSMPTTLAARSRVPVERVVDASLVWSARTAGWIAGWQELAYCQPRVVATLDTDRRAAHLVPGSLVEITATELGWSRRLCGVRHRRRSGDRTTLEILTWRRY